MEMASEDPDISKIPLVGVIKEVAPTTQAETDETLGVGEFHEKYFGLQYPLYLDEEKSFYEYLGNRKLSIPFSAILKPWKAFRYYKSMTARMKEKNIEGNMVGEGLVQGGLLVIAPGTGLDVLYRYEEVTGSEVPMDDFVQGLKRVLVHGK